MNDKITKMNNTLETINNNCDRRMDKWPGKEDSLTDLWYNSTHTNICITGVPKGEERDKGLKKIFEEIIA